MEKFLKQIVDRNFKDCNYTIFNKLSDGGTLKTLESTLKKKLWKEDFEYLLLDFEEREKIGIKYRNPNIMDPLKELENILMYHLQDDIGKPKSFFVVNKEDSYAYIVKLKDFDLVNNVNVYIKENGIK